MIRRPKSRLFPAAFRMVATMAALAGLVLETGQPKAAMASDLPATTAGVGLARVFEAMASRCSSTATASCTWTDLPMAAVRANRAGSVAWAA